MIKYVSKCIKHTRAIAQLVRQCFFRGVHPVIKRADLIEKWMSDSILGNKRKIA
ncbi:hypothetical protein Lalb_Chr13g0292721 [Lupinus albus]|uniref:Uncharacterized protein n=1 Tax=Lupinus albus TaxID=3870 RepID=A0A6A4PHG0_LUPAL|nr:hypothetical protein Lalb_Chr13g0292721 [Lupinus albus]